MRKQIKNGVYYTYLSGDFKKDRIAVFLCSPLKRENITSTALVPYLLERGCESLPDITLLRRRLDMLYGANLYTSASTVDYTRVLGVSIGGVEGSLVPDGEQIFKQRAELLFEVLLKPAAENGAFKKEWVDIEREKLREVIRSEMNEKRAYCLKLASAAYFAGDDRALPNNGYAEDLNAIDGESLYRDYIAALQSSRVEIFHVGRGETGNEELFQELLAGYDFAPEPIKPPAAVAKAAPTREQLEFDVEQDKLALVFTAGRLLSRREQTAFRLAAALLGGTPTSRLFMNVREKQSLCYYCAARPGLMSGSLTIDSGIETGDDQKVKAAVLAELEKLQAGDATQKELEQTKLFIKNSLSSVRNLPDSLAGWYFSTLMMYGESVSPEQEIENIMAIEAHELGEVLSLFSLKTECLLTNGGARADG